MSVSPATVLRIAANVFRESVRDKVLYSIVLFAILIISASLLLGQLTAGQEVKIIKDLGLSAISLFGHFIAIFIGIGLVSKEVEKKSVFGLLSKPVSRTQFILGKYAGLVMTLAVNLGVMTIAYYAVLYYMYFTATASARAGWPAPAMDPRLLIAIGLIFAELMLVTALALFFSTYSSPLLATLLTIGLWVAGHFNADLRNFENVVDSAAAAALARAVYYILPNLAPFDVKAEAVYGMPIAMRSVLYTLAYAVVYITTLLTAAVAIFRRRDFK
jgi:ABC-type transport system involved in multi-copper enzyme maturation permease subunit